ncbi:uncharacterized protein LOC112591464 isoform X2 [Melanaphis sacchari]|uniref:uncharacterized protein LOC112591464 isoform X2 n=1 Tax=Melanaphis sacchari TaxID=742174 RepID=UPI000DC13642|nr:uncharacterized protein LOC112591464 isoform X2 [Melanaphis sacchari]
MSNLIEIDEIIFNLKATITSNKGGVQLNCIESDYYNLIGEPIPYKNLGFNSIVDFLESFKEVFKIKNKGFNKFVYVISGGKTQHLEKMISKQKTKSKRKYKSKSQSVVSNKKLNTSNTYNNSMNYRLRKKKPPVDNSIYPTNKNNSRSSKINDENKLFKKRDEPRVFAQDRLKKYEKKNINQIENKELKNEVTSEDSVLELSKIFTKQCNIRDTVFTKACNIPIQSKQLPEYYNEHINLKINQYTFESKCKKIVTVTAVFSPSSICVVLEDYNINAMKAILNKLKLFDEFPFIKEIVIEKLLETKCILIPNSVITDPPTVTLYDLETRMNINDIIINSFYKKVTPEINFGDGYDFAEVKLILVENGYCYVQFNQDLIKSLEKIFSTDQFFGPYLKNARDIDYKNIYLAYYGQNIKGRVKVEYFTSNYQVKVYFIDYGCFKNVEVNTLVDLSRINTYLVRIPSQAFKVALHMFPPEDVTSRTVEELFSILGNNTNVKMYKLKNFMGPIPCVKLWNIAYPDTFINIILYLRLSELNQ